MNCCCNIDDSTSVELVDPVYTPAVKPLMHEALPTLLDAQDSIIVEMDKTSKDALPMLIETQDSSTMGMNKPSKNDPAELKRVVQEKDKTETEVVTTRGADSQQREDAVIAVFDADGTEQTILLKFRPLGLKFYPTVPIVVKGFEKGAYGETLGIKTGWTLKSLDVEDILGKPDFKTALDAMKNRMQHLPTYEKAVIAVFDVDGTEQTILVKCRPLGLKFHPRTPIVVKGFEKGAYGETLGIKTGWTLKSLDAEDILQADFKAALEAMKQHMQHLPTYDHQF